jgi:hypothetical protein
MNERDVHLGTFLHFPFLFLHTSSLVYNYPGYIVQPFVVFLTKLRNDGRMEERHFVKEKGDSSLGSCFHSLQAQRHLKVRSFTRSGPDEATEYRVGPLDLRNILTGNIPGICKWTKSASTSPNWQRYSKQAQTEHWKQSNFSALQRHDRSLQVRRSSRSTRNNPHRMWT